MPIGTMLYQKQDAHHLIFLGVRDKFHEDHRGGQITTSKPMVLVFCVEEQRESDYPFYSFLSDIQRGELDVVHIPNNPQT